MLDTNITVKASAYTSPKFADLKFGPHQNFGTGIQAYMEFPNGYAASVIQSMYSYGGYQGLYEIGLLDGSYSVDYTTDVLPDGVKGYLTQDAVTDYLVKIQALPAKS